LKESFYHHIQRLMAIGNFALFAGINRDKLGNNPRIGFAYPAWDRMDGATRVDIVQQAELYLDAIEAL
jgi:deoxyribodipyrimidine photolyase-like uncharacterized protein